MIPNCSPNSGYEVRRHEKTCMTTQSVTHACSYAMGLLSTSQESGPQRYGRSNSHERDQDNEREIVRVHFALDPIVPLPVRWVK